MTTTPRQSDLPAPTDPTPRWQPLSLELPGGRTVTVQDDTYSDRIRCDHPAADLDGAALGQALVEAARQRQRGRVVLLCPAELRGGLEGVGFAFEALMPGFYGGAGDCAVLGLALDPQREALADAAAVEGVQALFEAPPPAREHPRVPTERATPAQAEELAELLAATFEHYPTPSGVPAYLAKQIGEGVPFRLVREGGEVIACASADLVRQARTAELTDCATRPEQRGRGLMQWILTDLMDDLRAMDYPTAFTLARARIAGVNLAFLRLGFHYRGRMVRSCRIGGGMEDMNVWSRPL